MVNVQDVLNAFDTLPAAQKHEAAVEILRRVSKAEPPDLSDEALVALADELFSALDREEAQHGQP